MKKVQTICQGVEIYDGIAGYKRVSLQQWTKSGSAVSQGAALWLKE